ncbi:MAG TPA: hypothetical protein VGL92_15695 [Acidimicrobiia bacterium]|jgi:hypothetical protein
MRRLAVVLLVFIAGGCTSGSSDPAPAAGPPSSVGTTTAPTTATTLASSTTVTPAAPPPATSATPAAPPAAPPPDGPCEVPAGYPVPWPERPRYTAQLNVDAAARMVTGTLSVRFTPDAPTDRLVFRFWANSPRLGRAGSRFEVVTAFLGDQPIAGTYEAGGAAPGRPGTLYILPGSFPAGKTTEARIDFRLFLPGAVNDRVAMVGRSFRLGSVLPVLSWVRGSGWQTAPAVDAFAEAAASEVADWDVSVTAPAGYTTLATGIEAAPGRFVAEAVRDWAATVAPMRLAEAPAQGGRTTVVVGVAEGAAGDPAALARRVVDALDNLAARYGEYPYPRLSVGVTGSLTGGIEFPTHIHLGSGVPNIHLVHEVAHQWFYGVAGNDQYAHPFLDEALATYAEARVVGRVAAQRARSVPAAGRTRLGESMAYWNRQGRTYFLAVYIGGLQALAAYGDAIGGYDALDCALRRYHRDRAYTLSRPADLFDALARQTGVDPRPVLARFGLT